MGHGSGWGGLYVEFVNVQGISDLKAYEIGK